MSLLDTVLLVLGAGFLVANVRLAIHYGRFRRRQARAVLTWPAPKPPYFGLALAIGVMLGAIVFYKVIVSRQQAFGETMMFLYYAYLLPLSRRIRRGFYQDGIWVESGFLSYEDVGGLRWREAEHSVALVVVSRARNLARVLPVPVEHYAASRRLLRDKIGDRAIHLSGGGLDLGGDTDERDRA